LIWSKIEQNKNIRRSAREKEEVCEKKEGAGVPDLVGINGDSRRCLQACGLNFTQPGGVSVSEKGQGDKGGDGAL
jgi:hypothetical protein